MVKTVIEKQYPPEKWLKDCPDVPLKGEEFEDAIAQSVERGAVIDACNVDKQSLRDWASKQGADDGSE